MPTLRHYDELGLLKPAHVDKFTDYRYYEIDQLPRLNRILALKDLGLSLEQIKRLLNENVPSAQLRGMLARLQEKEEVLLLGWGVKMPIPIRSRRYDKRFYDEIRGRSPAAAPARPYTLEDANADLF